MDAETLSTIILLGSFLLLVLIRFLYFPYPNYKLEWALIF